LHIEVKLVPYVASTSIGLTATIHPKLYGSSILFAVTDVGITDPPLLNKIEPLPSIVQPPVPDQVVQPPTELYAFTAVNGTTFPGDDGFSKGRYTTSLECIALPIVQH